MEEKMDAMFVYGVRIDKVIMGQEANLTETEQPKFFTRSTARHLRRKRLHEARKAEKQQLCLTNGVNTDNNPGTVTEKNVGEAEVITKSKARRLRKKNKAKELSQNYCSFCYPYIYTPVINTTNDEETAVEKESENPETITKSKARRLRKKNKAKLLQGACSFCCPAYPRDIDPVLFEYTKTTEYDPNCCNKPKTEFLNNHVETYKPENIVELQAQHVKSDNKVGQSEPKSQNIESEEDLSELSHSSSSSGLLRLGNEVTGAEQKTFEVEVNCSKEETQLETSGTQLNVELVEDTLNSQEPKISTELEKIDRNNQTCSTVLNEEVVALKTCIVNSKKNDTQCSDEVDSSCETGLKLLAQANTKPETTLYLAKPSENENNFDLNDSPKNTSSNSAEKDTRATYNITETHSDTTNTILDIRNPDLTKEEVHGDLLTESTTAQHSVSDFNSSKEAEVTVVTIAESSGETDVGSGRVTSAFPQSQGTSMKKMLDNKVKIPEKSREEIKAEREAKKAAKAAAKAKAKGVKTQEKQDTSKETSTPSENEKNAKNDDKSQIVNNEIVETSSKSCVIGKAPDVYAKDGTSDVKNEGKSKAELRAERRAKQEAQRAAKQQLAAEKVVVKKSVDINHVPSSEVLADVTKKTVAVKKIATKENAHEVNLFKHLYHERELAFVHVLLVNSNIHPAIVRLGVQYANKVIVGSNARCVALLAAVKQLIQDFERPSQADFIRGLEASLQESAAYLHHCRPLAVSMQNALKHLKWQMTQLPSTLSDIDAKRELESAIDTYISEQIELADKAISITIQTKISNGNVILTYGYSSLIHKILLDAHTAGKKFRVIVVDGRPWLEGKEQLRRLAKHGIECSYILINALSYVMPEVSKVFLGAHAILANGAVMSRVGTAQVALMARAFNVPVLVACETHKSCERVQTDSIVYNELGNADELATSNGSGLKKSLLANWRTKMSLNLLNITYDVTPADLVTAVVTELAILPCTSVPVILRIKPSEI